MSEKPILFNTEMVRAIMEGRKTVTRRIIKNVNDKDFIGFVTCSTSRSNEGKAGFGKGSFEDISNANIEEYVRPPYKVGDILYVRETWSTQYNGVDDDNGYGEYVYKADGVELDNSEGNYSKWRPSIHMPKEAARIFLRVTNVRVERLQGITDEGCYKEGISDTRFYDEAEHIQIAGIGLNDSLERAAFSLLWNSTLKKFDVESSWHKNPWVWVIEFERMEKGNESNE